MLRRIREIEDYVLEAEDGDLGRCHDFLFHDQSWIVRYVVADTRKWLPGRKVLVPLTMLGSLPWDKHRLPVHLTREQIKHGPSLDKDRPVLREYEMEMFNHYGWTPYWSADEPTPGSVPGQSHLYSAREVMDCHIRARDGKIGHLEDLFLDVHEWIVRYLIVDTLDILPGRENKVLLLPQQVESVDTPRSEIRVSLDVQEVKDSPEYNLSDPLEREFELVLHDYYGWPQYWEG